MTDGYVVRNHGDRFSSPKDVGLWDPGTLPWPFFYGGNKWGVIRSLLTIPGMILHHGNLRYPRKDTFTPRNSRP